MEIVMIKLSRLIKTLKSFERSTLMKSFQKTALMALIDESRDGSSKKRKHQGEEASRDASNVYDKLCQVK